MELVELRQVAQHYAEEYTRLEHMEARKIRVGKGLRLQRERTEAARVAVGTAFGGSLISFARIFLVASESNRGS